MSVNKFKVGDKVRVRKELVAGKRYGEQCFVSGMYSMIGRIVTIKEVRSQEYRLEETAWGWTDEMLEPVEKTLKDLERGDLINHKNGDTRKVLVALDGVYLLSFSNDHCAADNWLTVHELELLKYKPVQSEKPSPETIEIGGKKYNKQEFEEAVKNLEPVD